MKRDYPYKAVREVLVNAVIHRDYQIQGAEIHVDMYDDRMEITSPDGMLNGSRIQDLDLLHVPSRRRNEIISDVFGRLHYMDRRGSGIGRIMNSYAEFVATQLSRNNGKVDWELSYFKDVVLNKKNASFRGKTVEGIIVLFDRYRYSYNFNRRNFADVLNVSENWASQLIKKCINMGIMAKVRKDEYCFIADKDITE